MSVIYAKHPQEPNLTNTPFCKGAARGETNYADNCYPFDIWAATLEGSRKYHWSYFNNGDFSAKEGIPDTLAFSVRHSATGTG